MTRFSSVLTDHLRDMPAQALADVLRTRPDVAAPPLPGLPEHLAVRLADPDRVQAAEECLGRPEAQVLDAAWACAAEIVDSHVPTGGRRGPWPRVESEPVLLARFEDVRALLGATGRKAAADVAFFVDKLALRGLVAAAPEGLRLHPASRGRYAAPLGLDGRVLPMLEALNADEVRVIARNLGAKVTGLSKGPLIELTAALLSDGSRLGALRAAVPEECRESAERMLDALIGTGRWDGYVQYETLRRTPSPRLSPEGLAQWWLRVHGLAFGGGHRHLRMPREVALALRGEDYRAPFTPTAPTLASAPQQMARVTREGAAAAATAVRRVDDVLRTAVEAPVPLLKGSSGVGARELRRLAKTLGCPQTETAFWLHLAVHAGLLSPVGRGLCPTSGYERWRRGTPAARLAALLRSWPTLPALPLLVGPDAPALLSDEAERAGAAGARQALTEVLRALPEGHGVREDELVAAVVWGCPKLFDAPGDEELAELRRRHCEPYARYEADRELESGWGGDDYGDEDYFELNGDDCDCAGCRKAAALFAASPRPADLVAALCAEATLLGVLGHGAPTALGRATGTGIARAAEEVLPPPVGTVRFQADLTATATGVPVHELSDLLESCAHAEARGPATVWRFSADSVRPFLDTDGHAEELLRELTAVGEGGRELPQSLRCLIDDVARRHGHIRAAGAPSCLWSEDQALIAELSANRALASLGLRRIAPTVLLGARPLGEALDLLRAAGYAPVAAAESGSASVTRRPPAREPAADKDDPVEDMAVLDPLRWAHALLAAGDTEPPVWRGRAPHIAQAAPELAARDCARLADAIENGRPVRLQVRGQDSLIALARPVLAMDSYVTTLTPDDTEDYGETYPLSRILRVLPAGDSRKNTDGEGHGHG
ncbi:helicase-associated domain-containing protein [Streptomyces sp. NPDC005151]